MKTKTNELHVFLKEISKSYQPYPKSNHNFNDLINNAYCSHECFYVLDFSLNKISYRQGFDKLLGYADEDISIDFMSHKIHDDDREMVSKIRMATATFSLNNPNTDLDYKLSLTYRVKKIDNSFINVLSQSLIYDADKSGRLISIFNRLTDITFMNNPMPVNWYFEGNDLDKKAFKKEIYKEYQNFFTKRELDVIVRLSEGCTNKLIAEKLNISMHTVATHRKRIFKKSRCHNVSDLLFFCSKNGIL
jgi:DNA-binding CsgD family transcriptional regulator